MKKIALSLFVVTIALSLFSCTKDYTCKCTYVHYTTGFDSIPQPDINEEFKVSGRFHEQALFECEDNESKYMFNNYKGTCLIP